MRVRYTPSSPLRFADTALNTQMKSCYSLACILTREKRQGTNGQMLHSENWKPWLCACALSVCRGDAGSQVEMHPTPRRSIWSPVALFMASAARASPRCPCLGPGRPQQEDAGRLSAVLCAASGSGFSFQPAAIMTSQISKWVRDWAWWPVVSKPGLQDTSLARETSLGAESTIYNAACMRYMWSLWAYSVPRASSLGVLREGWVHLEGSGLAAQIPRLPRGGSLSSFGGWILYLAFWEEMVTMEEF